jgi:Asp-tRNA(Asn)/Glu-tRNA(Gln) amidotransferase A subunit family amidase
MKNIQQIKKPNYTLIQKTNKKLTENNAVCLPIGFNKEGNPVSITFLGKLYDEASILEAAKSYQDKTDYHKKHPLLFVNN